MFLLTKGTEKKKRAKSRNPKDCSFCIEIKDYLEIENGELNSKCSVLTAGNQKISVGYSKDIVIQLEVCY